VYYEREADPIPTGFIQMDWVTVELSVDQSIWYIAFVWGLGDEPLAQNSNVAPYAVSGMRNPDPLMFDCDLQAGAAANEVIYMDAGGPGGITCLAWGGLYPGPVRTGIAIDIAGLPPPPPLEGYRYIRIRARGPNPAEIDGIERLN